ncbi:MAG: hypothetical protein HC860_16765 [Alkalinema sp. RU_4_3]|nr:hypothetical protein [Alkalinema sp. RU_4_3]
MCWLRPFGATAHSLHLRLDASKPWRLYSSFPFSVPDYRIPGGSKGWATYQSLRQAGWALISTQEASRQLIQSVEPDDTSIRKAA